MIKVIFQMLGILFLQAVLIAAVHQHSRKPAEPISFPEHDYSIQVGHDNYGNCFAFVMEADQHKYAVNCKDTLGLR